ncbi:MAG: hypothetical protein ACTSRA_08670 [Promethearchaeota archaeon]
MNLVELLELFTKKEFSIILRCLIDRIPIIIGGNDKEFVDEVVMKLCDLLPMRKEIIFGNEFFELDEYNAIITEENMDYDNQRSIFRAPVNFEDSIIKNIDNIKGWVVGILMNGDENIFFEKASRLRKKNSRSLFIKFDEQNRVEFVETFNFDKHDLNLKFERNIIQKIINQTENSLERMKRVLDKKIQTQSNLNESIVKSLVDLSQEECIIKESIFKKELIEFYHACRRGLAILSRLSFLNQFHPVKIGKKAFFDAISYDSVDIKRFLEFIKAEWEEDFENLIDTSRVSIIGDHLDSLWG